MTGESTRSQSPELTGGAGFTYEAHVAARYLVALLTEGSAPGLNHRIVKRVALQQKSAGEPLDDVIVDANGVGDESRLSLQVKRQLTVSSAATNTDFREVVVNSWATLHKPDFRENVDRFGTATGTVSAERLRELRRVCELARNSTDAASFFARGDEHGNAGADFNTIIGVFRTILADNGIDTSNQDLHRLLKHFVVVQFDFLSEEATEASDAVEKLRAFLPSQSERAPDLWQQLVGTARDGSGKAGEYDRVTLVSRLGAWYRLAPAPSLRADLEILERFAADGIASVLTDIAGSRIDRPRLREEVRLASEQHRFVQIRGLPGTGKSVLLHDLAVAHRTTGITLFLKSDRLQGNNWIEFAAALGLSTTDPRLLLTELAAGGPPVLFLDGIDRINGAHRNVIVDLLNTVFATPDSPWKVIATLRDTGIEPLRTWLPKAAIGDRVGSVEVPAFDDAEAEVLSEQQPSLRPLLLGNPRLQAVARRPFFASVLAKTTPDESGTDAPAPQSEADLIKQWWKGGGYGADAASVLQRKRALLEIASKCASRSGMNVRLSRLAPETAACLYELVEDGIIQAVGDDDRYRFAHDIYFEWSFYQLLQDREDDWIPALTEAGEPPVLGRVVELLAQSKLASGEWAAGLATLEASPLRAQWRRAWLIGPLASADFEEHQDAFESAVSADGYKSLNQLLVWFQAERTTPNALVLQNESLSYSGPERIQYADRFGWPSDPRAWRRLIEWAIEREGQLPAEMVPNLVSVFEVWQNAFSMTPNPVSQSIVDKALDWLVDLENRRYASGWPYDHGRWQGLDGDTLDELESSLRVLVLTSAIAYPAQAARYLSHLNESRRYRRKAFSDVLIYSTTLAQAVPDDLVGLFRSEMLALLPEDQLAEWAREREEQIRELQRIRALPESERQAYERFPMSPMLPSHLGDHDWHDLAIEEHHGHFFPASPLREPFRSLFEHSPAHARTLVRTVVNHATTAWRQLHQHPEGARGTPLPLELEFPWGRQTFWGDPGHYQWFRGGQSPYTVASALMALERWAFAEIDKGRPVDEVARDVLEGHDNWAVLGVATTLYLETLQVSAVSAALIGSQRLWKVDLARQLRDQSARTNLMGFGGMLGEKKKVDRPHYDAVDADNRRRCRQWSLRDLTPLHLFADDAIRSTFVDAVAQFPEQLPFNYAEEAGDPDHVADLRTTAEIWAEWAKPENYHVGTPDPETARILVNFHNPRAQAPDVQALLAQTNASMQPHSLWIWVHGYFETGQPPDGFTLDHAVRIAQSLDGPELFNAQSDSDLDLEVTRGAVCGVAAVVKCFGTEPEPALLAWASDVVARGSRMPVPTGDAWSSVAVVPWHPGIFIARACAADIHRGRDSETAKSILYALCGHPVDGVSLAAFEAALSGWNDDKRFAWIALDLAVRLAEGTRRNGQLPEAERAAQRASEIDVHVRNARASYAEGTAYPDISAPSPPWVESPEDTADTPSRRRAASEGWQRSERYWRAEHFGTILGNAPLEQMLSDPQRREQCLQLLDRLLDWTLEFINPSWDENPDKRSSRSTGLGTWIPDYAHALARIVAVLGAGEMSARYLQRIFSLEDELCASFLNPFVSRLTAQVMDAPEVPADAIEILLACTDRLLADRAFDSWRRRDAIYGFDLPYLVRNLFFVGIEQANGAARFANGSWKDIDSILPIVDKLVRAAGQKSSVMENYLTLCERAAGRYPTEVFADQVLAVLGDQDLPAWRNTMLAGRIAGLVQVHADRGAPLELSLSRKLLQILDHLVDMGDRRSAALQLSDAFKDVRLPRTSEVQIQAG